MSFEFTYGTENDDVITFDTNILQRVFFAGAGNDTITGADFSNYEGNHLGSTWEVIYGEAGDDIIRSGRDVKNSLLDGGDGNDTITSSSIVSDIYGGKGDDVIDSFGYIANIYGGDGNDIITTYNDANSSIYGGNGNDTIYSEYGLGGAIISGGLGADKIYGSQIYQFFNPNSVFSSDIVDYSDSQSAIYVNLGEQGKDAILFGTATDSTAYGDEIYNFSDLIAGKGNDKIIGSNFRNSISLGAGDDEAYGFGGDDTLIGGNGNNTLYGGSGDDMLFAGTGNDRLLGGDGDDIIYMGFGKDNAWGGNGHDEFIIQKTNEVYIIGSIGQANAGSADAAYINDSTIANTDIIRDFNSAEDMIDLRDLGSAMSSIQIGASKTAGITGFNISANGVFSVDVLTGNTGDLTLANVII